MLDLYTQWDRSSLPATEQESLPLQGRVAPHTWVAPSSLSKWEC
jgi:hypothetical protein